MLTITRLVLLPKRYFYLLTSTTFLLGTAVFNVTFAQMPQVAKHVLVIGVDGLAPFGIKQANTPTLDSLIAIGASSMQAQAVMPTSSSPNWASMIMGATPNEHTITSNAWEITDIADTTLCDGEEGQLWPTIFRVVREQKPDADIATFYDWSGFGRLLENGVATMKGDTKGEDKTAEAAADYWRNYQPTFMFVHLDHVDHAGHSHKWGSNHYNEAVEKSDQLIGNILQAVWESGTAENTLVVVTSDHGGKETSHGGDTPEERTIPWIVAGVGVRTNHAIQQDIEIYDTAATIAYALGLTAPDCWIGKPITEIFRNEELRVKGER
ncbi:alkaline phosphatase family protein [Tunicatimonas pelagia]|uniref:alkaline phosphatase family protein n=1 Tax=Tunicatimonas pelagia TaxID=931531 RepID=UPI0026653F0E|nr:alkaline phosphatase [Tunicatimonas pelagia]WKN43411.1 alkaline phosphatase [Tunicatimonas pelagia]